MRSLLSALALTGLLTLSGCGSDDSTTEQPQIPPDPPVGDLISFHKAGGLAYQEQALTVRSNGDATLEGTGIPNASFTLSDDELATLEKALDDHPIDELDPPATDTGCADCFSYRLEYDGGRYDVDDSSISDDASEVVAALGVVIASHQPAGGGY